MGFYVLESRAEPVTPAAASELHKNCVMLVVNDRIGASAGCAEVDGEVLGWLREATEAEVAAAVECEVRAYGSARDAACLPFGMVGELRRKLDPIALAVLLLFMGVGIRFFGFRQSFRACASVLHSTQHRPTASIDRSTDDDSHPGGASGSRCSWAQKRGVDERAL